MSSGIRDVFYDLIHNLTVIGYPIHDRLLPPATEDQLEACEASLGFLLPTEVWELYTLHNGSQEQGYWCIFPSQQFLPLESAIHLAQIWRETQAEFFVPGQMGCDAWRPQFLPLFAYEDTSCKAVECSNIRTDCGRVFNCEQECAESFNCFPSVTQCIQFFSTAIRHGLVECNASSQLKLDFKGYDHLFAREFPDLRNKPDPLPESLPGTDG